MYNIYKNNLGKELIDMYTIMIIDDNEQLQNEIGNVMIRNGYSIIKPKDSVIFPI